MTLHLAVPWRLAALLCVAALAAGCTVGAADPPLGGVERLPQGDPPAGTAYAEPVEGRPAAPSFTLELLDGEQIDGADVWEDRAAVLYFFASWCRLCQQQQGELSEVAREYGDRVVFLGVAGEDSHEDVEAYLREHGVPYAVGIDETLEVWLRYGVEEPPLIAFVTRGGTLVRGNPGGLDGDAVREAIDDLLLDS